ncbi:hypothetical protein [Streptomyces sp. BE308]|uniref:hypothetical protein n=1 Tax=Streptomyces sp. BE308 TaxID=3002529 RepID=UPI003FA7AF04
MQVGWDQCVCVSSDKPCLRAVAHTRALGLFPERLETSPYDADFDEPGVRRPADERPERFDRFPAVLASLDLPFVIERPDELRGLVEALAERLTKSARRSPPHA